MTTVCGDTLPGATTSTAVLSGTAVQDLKPTPPASPGSTWDNKGQAVPVSFVPSDGGRRDVYQGVVTIGLLDVGEGDTAGENMTSDFPSGSFAGDPVWEDEVPAAERLGAAASSLEDVDA